MVEEFDPAPTRDRRRHDKIDRDEQQVTDSAGAIGLPWRVRGLLAQLENRGAIGKPERMAGETFRDKFYLAQLDPIRALDMAGIPGCARPARHCGTCTSA